MDRPTDGTDHVVVEMPILASEDGVAGHEDKPHDETIIREEAAGSGARPKIKSESANGGAPQPVSSTSLATPQLAPIAALYINTIMAQLLAKLATSPSPAPQSVSGPAPTHVKVQAPKKFAAGQNFRIWMERFEVYAEGETTTTLV
jgi:hypothetical protein